MSPWGPNHVETPGIGPSAPGLERDWIAYRCGLGGVVTGELQAAAGLDASCYEQRQSPRGGGGAGGPGPAALPRAAGENPPAAARRWTASTATRRARLARPLPQVAARPHDQGPRRRGLLADPWLARGAARPGRRGRRGPGQGRGRPPRRPAAGVLPRPGAGAGRPAGARAQAFERAIGRRPQRNDLLEIFQALGRVYQRTQKSD